MEDRALEVYAIDVPAGFRARVLLTQFAERQHVLLLEKQDKKSGLWMCVDRKDIPQSTDYSRQEIQTIMSKMISLELENKVLKEMIVAKGQ